MEHEHGAGEAGEGDEVGQNIDHDSVLAEIAEAELRARPGWEIVALASMAIVNFWFVPNGWNGEELDKLNSATSKRAIEENLAAPLTTKMTGMVVLQSCAISQGLSEDEMREIICRLDNRICATHNNPLSRENK